MRRFYFYVNFCIVISLFIIQLLSLAIGICSSNFPLKLQEVSFLFFFILLVYKSIKRNGLISFYTMFLGLCFLFNFSRFYLDLIHFSDIRVGEFYGRYRFSESTVAIVIFLLQCILLFIDFAFYSIPQLKIKKNELKENKFSKTIILIVLVCCLPFSLYASFLTFNYVKVYGYEAFLMNIMIDGKNIVPKYILIINYIFKLFFYVSFFYHFKKKEYLLIFGLYFINLFSVGIKGSRSSFLFPFFFYTIYLIGYKKLIKLSFNRILLFSICCYLFYYFSSSLRGIEPSSSTFLTIINSILYSLSCTLLLPLLYIEKIDVIKSFNTIPLVFGDLFSDYNIPVETYNITSIISQNKLYGLAESMFLEIIDTYLLFIPLCLLVGWMIKNVSKNIDRNKICNVFFIILGMSIPWMPRDCIFRVFFKTNIMFLFVSFVIYFVLEFISKFFIFNSKKMI